MDKEYRLKIIVDTQNRIVELYSLELYSPFSEKFFMVYQGFTLLDTVRLGLNPRGLNLDTIPLITLHW